MNWIYHIDLVSTERVEDDVYQDYLDSGEWFATPTLARRASEILEVGFDIEPEQPQSESEKIIEEIKAKPRKVKANGNRKRAD